MNPFAFILARFREGSTLAGLAALAQAAKYFAPQYAPALDMVTLVLGGSAAVVPDPASKK